MIARILSGLVGALMLLNCLWFFADLIKLEKIYLYQLGSGMLVSCIMSSNPGVQEIK